MGNAGPLDTLKTIAVAFPLDTLKTIAVAVSLETLKIIAVAIPLNTFKTIVVAVRAGYCYTPELFHLQLKVHFHRLMVQLIK